MQKTKETKNIVTKFADFYNSLSEENQARVADFIEGVNFTLSLKEKKDDSSNQRTKA